MRRQDHPRHADAIRLGEVPGLCIVGEAFWETLRRLPVIADNDAPVLITGETGTGKELAARAIHYLGPRAGYPFAPVNCAALPESLLEAELFGYERGAFTDAREARAGVVEQPRGGTVLLDEVDALTPHAQAALLRVIEERSVRRLGCGTPRPIDVRWMAATNRPLESLVEAGMFRADLYFRLGVLHLRLPPLRERRQDIPALAAHFITKHGRSREVRLSPEAMALLVAQPWRGNVRELENVLRRALLAADGPAILPEHLVSHCPPPSSRPLSYRALRHEVLAVFDRDYVDRLMEEHGGNISRAAAAAGLHRRQLQRLLQRRGATDSSQPATSFSHPPSAIEVPTEATPAPPLDSSAEPSHPVHAPAV